MTSCLFCNKDDHPTNECPLFGKTETYLQHYAPKIQPEEPKGSSLAPTQFEQLFGEGAEALLQDVVEGEPEDWTPAQRELALKILGGERQVRGLAGEERLILDSITEQLANPPAPRAPALPAAPVHPSWIATQAEMEGYHNDEGEQ